MLRLQYFYHLHAPFHRSVIFAMRPRHIVSVLSLHQLLHPGSGTSSLHAAMTNNDRDVAKRGVANLFSLLGSERLSFAFSFLSLFGRLPLCRRATTCEQHGGVILRFFLTWLNFAAGSRLLAALSRTWSHRSQVSGIISLACTLLVVKPLCGMSSFHFRPSLFSLVRYLGKSLDFSFV